MSILNKWFWKLIWMLVSGYALLIIINAMLFAGIRRNMPLPVNFLVVIALMIGGGLFLSLLVEWLQERPHWRKRLSWIALGGLFIIELVLATQLQGAQGVDDFDMRRQIANLVAGNYHWDSYFYFGPNAGAVLFFSAIVKFFGGNAHQSLILNLVNFALIDAAFLSGLGIVRRLGHRLSCWYFLLGIIFAPLWITALFVYTDVGALGFSMVGLYIYSKSERVNNVYLRVSLIFFAILFMTFAYFNKANTIILLIAAIIYYGLKIRLNDWKLVLRQLLILLVSVIISFSFISGVKQVCHVPASTYPATYWVAVGYNAQTDGTIGKNGVATWPGTGLLPTKEARTKYDNRLLKAEVKGNGLVGNLKLFLKKINVQWSLGTIGITSRSFMILSKSINLYNYLFGVKNGLLQVLSQCLYLIVLVGMLITALSKLTSNVTTPTMMELLALYFVGIFSFHTFFWEVQERYAYIVILPMVIIGAAGLSVISKNLSVYVNKAPKLLPQTGAALGVTFIVLVAGLMMSIHNAPERVGTQVVMGQNFFRKEPLLLKSGQTLREQVVMKKSFSGLFLGFDTDPAKVKVTINGKTIKQNQNVFNHDKLPGSYNLALENISPATIVIPTMVSPWMDLLQQPIKHYNDRYLDITATKTVHESIVELCVLIFTIGTGLLLIDSWFILNRRFTEVN